MSIKDLATNIKKDLPNTLVYVADKAFHDGELSYMEPIAIAIELPYDIDYTKLLVNQLNTGGYMGNTMFGFEDKENFFILTHMGEDIKTAEHFFPGDFLVISNYIENSPKLVHEPEDKTVSANMSDIFHNLRDTIVRPVYEALEPLYAILAFENNNHLLGSVYPQEGDGIPVITDSMGDHPYQSKQEATDAIIKLKQMNLPGLKYKLIEF